MLRNRGLLALLAAEVVSTTGSMMTWLALPWFVLSSASRMGIVLAAEAAGVEAFGIPGGHLAARLGARRTMVIANGIAGPAILLVPAVQTVTMGARALATLRRRESLPVTAS
jgi:MFS family permease